MDYTWLTLTDAENQLAARLADPNFIQWSQAECALYIQDALRFWNCLTNQWKTDFSFLNPGPFVWSRLDQIANSPRLRTVMDADVYTMMEYMLLEPPSGLTWTGSSQFSIGDLSGALLRRRNEIIQLSNCNQTLIYVPGMPNVRRYYVPDTTLEIQRMRYPLSESVQPSPFTTIPLTPQNPGPFTVTHGLGSAPFFVLIRMTSGGQIWLNPSGGYDAVNLYLEASDGGISGVAYCWSQAPDAAVPFTTSVGNFAVPHGLGQAPVMGYIELSGGVAVWFDNPSWDATNVYLGADGAGFSGRLILWKTTPAYVGQSQTINLALTAAGVFQVAHNLKQVPAIVLIDNTSPGAIWSQNPIAFDANNLYLVASDAGVTGTVTLWIPPLPFITGQGVTLVRDDTIAQEWFQDLYYQQPATAPDSWMVSDQPPLSFDVAPPPAYEGVFELLVLQSGVAFNPSAGPTLLNIPDDFAWLARWGALADLLGRESEATDRMRAAWCQKRYEEGLKLLVNTPWIMLGRVNNVATDLPSFLDMDRYAPEWDNATGAIDSVVTAGVDLLASQVGASTFVTVLGNAPFTDSAGYVQVSRDVWDAVLSYAQFLATFKMGGAEFKQAMELEKLFLSRAMEENGRLRKLGLYVDAILERAGGENRMQERA